MQQVCTYVHTYVFYSQADIEEFLDKVCDLFPVGKSEVSGVHGVHGACLLVECAVFKYACQANIYTLRTYIITETTTLFIVHNCIRHTIISASCRW